MIVPAGTEIVADEERRLTVRTPGNLVLQGSGNYHTLESTGGSIRIEPGAEIEAVHVLCADVCYVQGSLVAFRVAARALQIEEGARAHVVLRETAELEVGLTSRLVGNFDSERDLFGLLGRFANEVRALPLATAWREGHALPEVPVAALPPSGELASGAAVAIEVVAGSEGEGIAVAEPAEVPEPPQAPERVEVVAAQSEDAPAPPTPGEAAASAEEPEPLPDSLLFASLLLESALGGNDLTPAARRRLGELLKLLRSRDLEALRHTHRTLFGRMRDAGEEVRHAAELIAGWFEPAPNE